MNDLATPSPANGSGGFLARYLGLRDRLPGDLALRDEAAKAFSSAGLPTRKQEAWHYTSLKSLGEAGFREPLNEVSFAPVLGDLPELPTLVVVDGRYQPELSTPPAGVGVRRFADVPELAAPGAGLPMVALNAMLAEDGVRLHVADGVDAGALVLLSMAPNAHRPADMHPRHRIDLAPGAKLTLLEITRGEGPYLHNAVAEVRVGQGATLSHVRLQQESAEATHVSTTLAEVAEGGTYDAFVLTLGAALARTEIHVRLDGPRAEAHLNGAQMLDGEQHADVTTVVNHVAPGCASRQTVKNVLGGRSRGVFQGKIEVARAAQKTDGYQMSQALLLSPTAEIDFKPQLEIYADDVKCSHGATVGELDADQLFYLRTRGIPEPEARAILVRAFLAEALDVVRDDTARALLEAAIDAWWERRA